MTGRLGALLQTPISDRHRARAFAAAAAVLAVAGTALTLTADPPTDPAVPVGPAPHQTRIPSGTAPAPYGPPVAVVAVARRFADGYLAHLHAGRPAGRIPGATAALRRALARDQVRVVPGMRDRRPRVTDAQATRLDRERWTVAVEIRDRHVAYRLDLIVTTTPDGPRVTRLLED